MFTLTRLYKRAALNALRAVSYSADETKPVALRSRKRKSEGSLPESFVDTRPVRVLGGKGGDGCVSFLQLWANENAGPDGGDGGNGGHVIFQACREVKDLRNFKSVIQAEPGEKGYNKDCFGKSAKHTIIKVPVGTVVKIDGGKVIADLDTEGIMFVAAKGGAGGHGNRYFVNERNQSPEVAEYGANGESFQYILEVKCIAHIGLVGMPNAGKSTLLRAISRAKPLVAPYPFTTLKPHVGIVPYSDHEQVAVADLPGLIEGSHRNRGLGIQFLKHVERCVGLVYVIDVSVEQPWRQFEILQNELDLFNPQLRSRSKAVVANKIDLPEAQENLEEFKERINLPVIPASAKIGTNLKTLLDEIREIYDENPNDEKFKFT